MTTENVKQRRILIINYVGTKNEKNAGNPVISFGAHTEGQEDQKGGYECWGNDLVNMVVKDARLDCEVTFVPRGDDIIQRVTQMFDKDGKEIRPKRQGPGRGSYGGGGGKSDYQARIEVISAEGRAAFAGLVELVKVDKLPEGDLPKVLAWGRKKLSGSDNVAPVPAQPVTQSAGNETKPGKDDTKTPSGESVKKNLVNKETLAAMAAVIKEKGYDAEEVKASISSKCKVDQPGEMTQPQAEGFLKTLENGSWKK